MSDIAMQTRDQMLDLQDFLVALPVPVLDSYIKVSNTDVANESINFLQEFLELKESKTWQLFQTYMEFESHLLDGRLQSLNLLDKQLRSLHSRLLPKFLPDYMQLALAFSKERDELLTQIAFKNQYPLQALSIILMPLIAEKQRRKEIRAYCLDVLKYAVNSAAIEIFKSFCGAEPGAPAINTKLINKFNEVFSPIGIYYEQPLLKLVQIDLGQNDAEITKRMQNLLLAAEKLSWSSKVPGFPYYARTILEKNLISFKAIIKKNCINHLLDDKEAFDFLWGESGPYTIQENAKILSSKWSKVKFNWNWALDANDWALQGICSESGRYEMVWGIDICFAEDSHKMLTNIMQELSFSRHEGEAQGYAQRLLSLEKMLEHLNKKIPYIYTHNKAGLLFSYQAVQESGNDLNNARQFSANLL